jgi:hypothetical protein
LVIVNVPVSEEMIALPLFDIHVNFADVP